MAHQDVMRFKEARAFSNEKIRWPKFNFQHCTVINSRIIMSNVALVFVISFTRITFFFQLDLIPCFNHVPAWTIFLIFKLTCTQLISFVTKDSVRSNCSQHNNHFMHYFSIDPHWVIISQWSYCTEGRPIRGILRLSRTALWLQFGRGK